jgi:hypothetical protein
VAALKVLGVAPPAWAAGGPSHSAPAASRTGPGDIIAVVRNVPKAIGEARARGSTALDQQASIT